MKKESNFQKLLFGINIMIACILLLLYLIPFCNPIIFKSFTFLSLGLPIFLFLNIGFLIYWFVDLNKKLFLSLVVLLIGMGYIPKLFQLQSKSIHKNNNALKIMSYNVRLFNKYRWVKINDIDVKIIKFIEQKSPDILCLQEYVDIKKSNKQLEKLFKYHYKIISSTVTGMGQAIFSKYPIIKQGNLKFYQSANNTIFADIVKEIDTFRVYNIHLESFGMFLKKKNFGAKNGEYFLETFQNAFAKQATQVQKIIIHDKTSPHSSIFAGDFNNTPFSWVYRELKQNKNDAFIQAGKGFGSTYNFTFPLRIDFILVDKCFDIQYFETCNVNYADHFPIIAEIEPSKNKL